MTHLTPDQFVDAVEGRVDRHPGATSHLAGCESCRAELASLSEVLTTARAVDVPEPSPLFWEHFGRRVRAAVETEPAPRRASWLSDLWRPLAVVATAAVAVALVVVFRPMTPSTNSSVVSPVEQTAAVTSGDVDASDEARLTVVAAVAQDLETEELQQAVRPSADAAGAALEELTPAQCEELMRLIKTQMIGAE